LELAFRRHPLDTSAGTAKRAQRMEWKILVRRSRDAAIEKVVLSEDIFTVTKSENRRFEKTIDPFSGDQICPNRYPTKVSAHWVKNWVSKNNLRLTEYQQSRLTEMLTKEAEVAELLECIPLQNEKKMFTDSLLLSEEKHLVELKQLLMFCRLNGLTMMFTDHSKVDIYSEDLKTHESLHTQTSFFSFNTLTRSFSASKKHFKIIFQKAKKCAKNNIKARGDWGPLSTSPTPCEGAIQSPLDT
jgi:hypothetical protein